MSVIFPPFSHGTGDVPNRPLARFLPLLPEGMVSAWLKQHVPKGSWVLDPIASSPTLALEAAGAGYRVLVVCNNPILSFMLEVLAKAPTREDFLAAISELATSRRGEERLEAHFRGLYATDCPNCARRIGVKGLIWRKDEVAPTRRQVQCPYCKADGEFAVAASDLERLNLPGNPQLHQARALERICAAGDANRENAADILRAYLPRPLYFITTLINKIEGLGLTADRRNLLLALALCVCDRGNSLWHHPEGRSRPKQLVTPPEFLEANLWEVFESAATEWSGQARKITLTHWPQLPPENGGICLFSGRLKQLMPLPEDLVPQCALAVLPRPNQAFWTLSAVWAGWLWGREAAQPLSSALERKRYDWQWHTTALHSAFATLHRFSVDGFPLHTWLPEVVPGFLAAGMAAAQAGGFELRDVALCPEPEFAQLSWSRTTASKAAAPAHPPQKVIQQAVLAQLKERQEPCQYLPLYTAGLTALAEHLWLPSHQGQIASDTLNRIQSVMAEAFSHQTQVKRFESRVKAVESGWWWLTTPTLDAEMPLNDRVEMEVVRYLLKQDICSLPALENDLSGKFPGLLTPPRDLLQEIIASYAAPVPNQTGCWQLRASEKAETRRSDLHSVQISLARLGERLGFTVEGDFPVRWKRSTGEPALDLYPVVSGIISRAVLTSKGNPAQCILVIPGSRARLIAFKLRRDARLAELLEQGWRFLKFRLLREMVERAELTQDMFLDLLSGDPPTWEDSRQLSFF